MTALSKKEIRSLILEKELVADYIDLDTQLQPNGFDCTMRKVARISGTAKIDFDNSERVLPEVEEIEFENDWVFLEKGYYRVYLNEVVRIPEDMMALARPRSSLIRAGANVLTAVWDAGYIGRSEVGLVVYNESGIYLKRNARIVQLVFFRLDNRTEGYSGIYSGENL
ncbi:deoxyuridine 5'-triphosphate nucleotidohydrolase [Geoglobus acetivorans]|uniref:Probable deoxyuridine 5'-triphosphate nucleotidohydrolase n=1 Tax=Geoglobus acetivorans TaxID=565033 RepID=A0ABZ3H2N0_GEOAI|nr:deoxyuridine 5'-triphosphate nucleotidohydrolase [Geoglobus acetivorans]